MNFNSQPLRLAATLILAASIIICGDVILGIIARRFFPEPPSILLTLQPTAGLLNFWNLADRGLQPITVTGSSMMEYAFSPRSFEKAVEALTGKRLVAANVGVAHASVPFSYLFIRDIIASAGAKTIIYGTEMRAFGPTLKELEITPIGYALTRLDEPWRSIHLWLLRHSALFQYHTNIRELLTGQRELLPEKFGPDDDPGLVTSSKVFDGKTSPNSFSLLSNIADYNLAVKNLDALANFCNSARLTCIVINMPVHPSVNQQVKAEDAVRYQGALKRLIKHGIDVWDFNTIECLHHFEGGFVDLDHLNDIGAAIFTEMAAELYSRQSSGYALAPNALATCVNVNQDIYSVEF